MLIRLGLGLTSWSITESVAVVRKTGLELDHMSTPKRVGEKQSLTNHIAWKYTGERADIQDS